LFGHPAEADMQSNFNTTVDSLLKLV